MRHVDELTTSVLMSTSIPFVSRSSRKIQLEVPDNALGEPTKQQPARTLEFAHASFATLAFI